MTKVAPAGKRAGAEYGARRVPRPHAACELGDDDICRHHAAEGVSVTICSRRPRFTVAQSSWA